MKNLLVTVLLVILLGGGGCGGKFVFGIIQQSPWESPDANVFSPDLTSSSSSLHHEEQDCFTGLSIRLESCLSHTSDEMLQKIYWSILHTMRLQHLSTHRKLFETWAEGEEATGLTEEERSERSEGERSEGGEGERGGEG